MSTTFWTLHNNPSSSPMGNDLNGLHIEKIPGGYQLLPRNRTLPALATTSRTAPPFSFNGVSHDGQIWDLYIFTLDEGVDRSGVWSLPNVVGKEGSDTANIGVSATGPENGDYTAQGGGTGVDVETAAAASAKK